MGSSGRSMCGYFADMYYKIALVVLFCKLQPICRTHTRPHIPPVRISWRITMSFRQFLCIHMHYLCSSKHSLYINISTTHVEPNEKKCAEYLRRTSSIALYHYHSSMFAHTRKMQVIVMDRTKSKQNRIRKHFYVRTNVWWRWKEWK